MKPLMHFLTLGVKDLKKMKSFYTEKFGWKPMLEQGDIVFFKLNGFVLSLFPEKELAKDAGVKNDGKGFKRFTMAVCLRSEKEVDKLFEEVKQKKVKIVKAPHKAFWGGYSGYIEDPEHNLWEIAYNPFLAFDRKGNVKGNR